MYFVCLFVLTVRTFFFPSFWADAYLWSGCYAWSDLRGCYDWATIIFHWCFHSTAFQKMSLGLGCMLYTTDRVFQTGYSRFCGHFSKHPLWHDEAVWVSLWTMGCHYWMTEMSRNACILTETDVWCYSICELIQIGGCSFKNTHIFHIF